MVYTAPRAALLFTIVHERLLKLAIHIVLVCALILRFGQNVSTVWVVDIRYLFILGIFMYVVINFEMLSIKNIKNP